MNIYQKIAKVRVELQSSSIKKSGKNSFAGFDYFTLEDILPTINKLMDKYGLLSVFSMRTDCSSLMIFNAEEPTEIPIRFECPNAEAEIKGCTPVQCLGGEITYLKRYLYLNAFEIVEGDMLDALAGSDKITPKVETPKAEAPKQLTLDEAMKMTTTRGTKYADMDSEKLEWIVANAISERSKQAAQMILDSRDMDMSIDDIEDIDDKNDLPF